MSATPHGDWVEFSATLTRKTTEQLQAWSDRFDRGVIGLPAYLGIVSALYDATSGLIEREVMDLMAEIHRDLMAQVAAKSKK